MISSTCISCQMKLIFIFLTIFSINIPVFENRIECDERVIQQNKELTIINLLLCNIIYIYILHLII